MERRTKLSKIRAFLAVCDDFNKCIEAGIQDQPTWASRVLECLVKLVLLGHELRSVPVNVTDWSPTDVGMSRILNHQKVMWSINNAIGGDASYWTYFDILSGKRRAKAFLGTVGDDLWDIYSFTKPLAISRRRMKSHPDDFLFEIRIHMETIIWKDFICSIVILKRILTDK